MSLIAGTRLGVYEITALIGEGGITLIQNWNPEAKK